MREETREWRFYFIRHGETLSNMLGLRCGGEWDEPMTESGIAQVRHAAEVLRALAPTIDIVVTSPLLRTRQTAAILAMALGVPSVKDAAFIERRLGAWTGQPIATTEEQLAAGETPPGGEPEAEFHERVARGLERLRRDPSRTPLVVASRGVGRVLHILLGGDGKLRAGNAEPLEFIVEPDEPPTVRSLFD